MKKKVLLLVPLALVAIMLGVWQLSDARTFQLFGRIFPSAPCEERVVALTFDAGPTVTCIGKVLPYRKDVQATFFATGHEVEQNIDLASGIVADGYELGNHASSHPVLVFK